MIHSRGFWILIAAALLGLWVWPAAAAPPEVKAGAEPITELAQMGSGKKRRGGGKRKKREKLGLQSGDVNSPMHPAASRELQERTGLIKTGLKPVYPDDATCLEVKSFFGDQTRYDGSARAPFANHGYHGGFDVSADIGTPLVAIADGEVVHKYVGGRLVGIQIILRHTPDDTGLSVYVYTKYKHFDQMPDLELGDRVKMGQVLGPSGRTGTTGGHFGDAGYPHLHMSIYTSTSPDYKTKEKSVIPADVHQLDPVAIYLPAAPANVSSHAARDLPDAQKDVIVPYATADGTITPEGARLIWPFRCEPR